MKYLILIAILISPTAARATVPVGQAVYEGTVGKSPVVLEIRTAGEGEKTISGGRYFYRKYRLNIPFRATVRNGATILQELDADCTYSVDDCPVRAEFTLKSMPGGLTGTWRKAESGAGTQVTLKQVKTRITALDTLPDDTAGLFDSEAVVAADPYLFRQLSGDTRYGPETRIGRVGYHMATDIDTGIHFIRLTTAPDAMALAKVNRLLDQRRFEMIGWGLECKATPASDNSAGGTLGDWETYDSRVIYATDSLIVIQEGGSTYCGGAYPNNSFNYSMYDLKRGEAFDITRVLNLYHPGKDADGNDVQVNTPAYDALLAKLGPDSSYADTASDITDAPADNMGYSYSLTFSDKGLVFSLTDLPHVMGASMGDYYVVPWDDLKTLWTPEAKAYFPQAR